MLIIRERWREGERERKNHRWKERERERSHCCRCIWLWGTFTSICCCWYNDSTTPPLDLDNKTDGIFTARHTICLYRNLEDRTCLNFKTGGIYTTLHVYIILNDKTTVANNIIINVPVYYAARGNIIKYWLWN